MSDITAFEAATACAVAAGAAECAPELYGYFHVYAASPGIALKAIGFELNAAYIDIAAKHRLAQGVLL